MSRPAFYIVRATLDRAGAAATVWVGRRTARGTAIWRWEVLRELWDSLGTAATADWVAEQFVQAHPDAADEITPGALAAAVGVALQTVTPRWPSP